MAYNRSTPDRSASITTTLRDPLKARFYYVQQNGSAIPLVALNELPFNIQIEGVPRALSFADIDGMVRVPGLYEPRHEVHQIVHLNKTSPVSVAAHLHGFLALNAQGRRPYEHEKPPHSSASDTPATKNVFPAPKKAYGINEQAPESNISNGSNHPVERLAAASSTFDPLPVWKDTNSLGTRLPPKGKKVYCSHWMSTGECDYAQQGCMYKHEMPFDVALLNHLGFQDIPKWYREQYGIGKFTAVPGSSAHIRGSSVSNVLGQPNWRPFPNKARPSATTTSRSTSYGNRNNRASARTSTARAAPALKQQNLLDLDSRPTSPSPSQSSNPLMRSKYATVEPLRPTYPPAESDGSVTDSDSKASASSNVAHRGSSRTPNTSVESLVRPTKTRAAHSSPRVKAQAPQLNTSRRTSIASDYETGLMQDLEDRDAREAKEYAEVKAGIERQKEQTRLKEVQAAALDKAGEAAVDTGSATTRSVKSAGGRSMTRGRGRKGERKTEHVQIEGSAC